MLKKILFFFLFLCQINAFSQDDAYLPKQNLPVYERSNYFFAYDELSNITSWVAYELTKEESFGNIERTNDFRPDPFIIDHDKIIVSDFVKTGYDRGHLAPAADMSFSKEAMSESFLLSNIAAQHPSLNRGIWRVVETNLRKYAQSNDIYIITGVIYDIKPEIGRLNIPEYFYKIAYDNTKNKAIAFLFKNDRPEYEVENYVVSIDSLEEITGIDFFWQLSDANENEVEKQSNFGDWFSENDKNVKKLATSVRCKGITKAGNHCKLKTLNPSGFCHHHSNQK